VRAADFLSNDQKNIFATPKIFAGFGEPKIEFGRISAAPAIRAPAMANFEGPKIMPDSMKTDRVAWTVKEFCSATRIGRSTFYQQVKRGNIKILKCGRRTLVPLAEITSFLKRLGEIA
jgi:excisionase family DNA binding protein